jgi:hypothetical protein
MTWGVIIPADESQPPRLKMFQDFTEYQEAVGGPFQALDLEAVPASFFVNDEGKLMGLEQNRRATLVWWASVAGIIGHDVLVGDVVLVGLPDDDGDTQSLPGELQRIFTQRDRFRVEYVRQKSPEPRVTVEIMETWPEAYEYACIIQGRFPDIISTKVVPF